MGTLPNSNPVEPRCGPPIKRTFPSRGACTPESCHREGQRLRNHSSSTFRRAISPKCAFTAGEGPRFLGRRGRFCIKGPVVNLRGGPMYAAGWEAPEMQQDQVSRGEGHKLTRRESSDFLRFSLAVRRAILVAEQRGDIGPDSKPSFDPSPARTSGFFLQSHSRSPEEGATMGNNPTRHRLCFGHWGILFISISIVRNKHPPPQ